MAKSFRKDRIGRRLAIYFLPPLGATSQDLGLVDSPTAPQESQRITAVAQLWSEILDMAECGWTLPWPSFGLPRVEKAFRGHGWIVESKKS